MEEPYLPKNVKWMKNISLAQVLLPFGNVFCKKGGTSSISPFSPPGELNAGCPLAGCSHLPTTQSIITGLLCDLDYSSVLDC
jgi:hypothetical protein